MAKSVRANLQLASENQVKTIIGRDLPEVTSTPSLYEKENLLGYYIIINTWLMIIRQWSMVGWTYVLDFMLKYGLFQTIREFDSAAAELINGQDPTFSIARMLYRDVVNRGPITGVPQSDVRTMLTRPISAMLFICRYPKRFSPLKADKLREASLEDFYQRQVALRAWQNQPISTYISSRVKEEMNQLVDWSHLCRELEDVTIDEIVFTPGVTFDTKADLVSKLRRVQARAAEYFPQPFGIPCIASKGDAEQQFYGKNGSYPVHTVRVVAVPKNYKAARIIAPEDVVRQAFARRYFIIMDRYSPRMVQLHDQTRNQQFALKGSIDGSLSTLDLSAASDSITATHLYTLFPSRFMSVISQVLPTHWTYRERTLLLQSAATMGNSVTFWLESILFLAIASAAVKEVDRWVGSEYSDHIDDISVYGDDIIVPTYAANTVVEWLEILGFTVNHDKSFIDGTYRESCGEEYLDGVNTSSVYFPRFPLEGTLGGSMSNKTHRDSYLGTEVDTLASLIDLQHKLFLVCEPASVLVKEVVKEACPRMTTSAPDQGLADLWSYESTPVELGAPTGEWVNGKLRRGQSEIYKRFGHVGPVTVISQPKGSKPLTEEDKMLIDLYKYNQFLRYGPRYDTELDKLLDVHARPLSYEDARYQSEIVWKLAQFLD